MTKNTFFKTDKTWGWKFLSHFYDKSKLNFLDSWSDYLFDCSLKIIVFFQCLGKHWDRNFAGIFFVTVVQLSKMMVINSRTAIAGDIIGLLLVFTIQRN